MCFFSAVFEMIPTIAINQILTYIQTGGEGARIKPIVWILSLFFSPTISSLAIQYYVFVMTRCLVRAEALLTQVLFDHALRLRMTDKVGEEEEEDEIPDVPAIQIDDHDVNVTNDVDPEVKVEGHEVPASADSETTAAADADAKEAAEPAAPGQGIAGKINVLMAQDIETVIEGELPFAHCS